MRHYSITGDARSPTDSWRTVGVAAPPLPTAPPVRTDRSGRSRRPQACIVRRMRACVCATTWPAHHCDQLAARDVEVEVHQGGGAVRVPGEVPVQADGGSDDVTRDVTGAVGGGRGGGGVADAVGGAGARGGAVGGGDLLR
jgi:hypothetical protein